MIPDELRKILLSPIRSGRVGEVPGSGGKKYSHVEAYEIRAHLIRLMDFDGWDSEITDMQQVFESEKDGKWTVCYRARCVLSVRWPSVTKLGNTLPPTVSTFAEWATGEAVNQPSRSDAHDNALKTAESQALKRCAVNLGDQFGLSLYRKGSKAALVGRTWNSATTPSATPPAVDEHVTESVPESEQAPAREDTHAQSVAPVETDDLDARALRVKDLTAQLLGAGSRSAIAGIAAQVGKEALNKALTDDGAGNVLTLGALLDARLKSIHRSVA